MLSVRGLTMPVLYPKKAMSNEQNSVISPPSDHRERILLISSRPLEHSGITHIVMDLINRSWESIDFDVASFGYYFGYKEQLKKKGIRCYKLSEKNHLLSYMRDIYRIVKTSRYHKVYIHGNSSLMTLEALPCRLAGARVITHCHNTKPPEAYFGYFFFKPIFNCLTDCKIACSKEAGDWAYIGKRTIIHNGIDVSRFSYDKEVRTAVRKRLGLSGRCVVGHIGSFNKQKNHQRLISIFEELIGIESNARLLLIGDGELKEGIVSDIHQRGLSEYVTVMDYVDDPEDYLQAMDVAIIPSLFEGFCLSALEAQVSGLPVIVSEAIPNAAYATNCCVKMHLKDSDREWALKALDMLNAERRDRSESVAKQGYDRQRMIDSIRSILLCGASYSPERTKNTKRP